MRKRKLMLSYDLRKGIKVQHGKSNRKLRWIVEVVADDATIEFIPREPVKILMLEGVINKVINEDEEVRNAKEIKCNIYVP